MVAENVFVQLSGTGFDGAVLAGSHTVQLCILCGMSGLGCYPVMVSNSGCLITQEIA